MSPYCSFLLQFLTVLGIQKTESWIGVFTKYNSVKWVKREHEIKEKSETKGGRGQDTYREIFPREFNKQQFITRSKLL